MDISESAIRYAKANQSRFIDELKEFVRFRTIGGQNQYAAELQKCAAWLAEHLRRIGLVSVKTIPTRRHPIVYAESRQLAGLPTVLVYGHYDVQPPDPLNEWRSPPFEPVIRRDSLYARGASDDKGQLFVHIKALESYLRTNGKLPVNVKCLFEGEEEIGSPNLGPFLEQNKNALAADVAVLSDTRMLGRHRPAITYALRGALSIELEVRGAERDLHSGNFGGAVHNPLQALCEILVSLHGSDGRVTVPGFYDRVRRCKETERSYMARVGPADAQILRDARARQGWGEQGYSLYERTTIRPALTINGIRGGYQREGIKAIVPARAIAKLDFRLVPDQDPSEIEQILRQHISRITPATVSSAVRTNMAAPPIVFSRRHPAMQSAAIAYERSFGARPVFIRSGGTIPVVSSLKTILGIPAVLMGLASPDDGMHAPNEKFDLYNFSTGILTSIYFMADVSAWRNSPIDLSRQRIGPAAYNVAV